MMLVIWGKRQQHQPATDWHDGQFSHGVYAFGSHLPTGCFGNDALVAKCSLGVIEFYSVRTLICFRATPALLAIGLRIEARISYNIDLPPLLRR
jgi:hypothetical protein